MVLVDERKYVIGFCIVHTHTHTHTHTDVPLEPSLSDILPNFSKDVLQVRHTPWGHVGSTSKPVFLFSYANPIVVRHLW